MILPRTGEEPRARCMRRARVRWGTVVRLVLTVRMARAVPHLSPDVAGSVRGAPPPFGGGALVRVAATSAEARSALCRASWLWVSWGSMLSPRGVPTEILGTSPRMTPWVGLVPGDEMPDVAWGRSSCACPVCQSRPLRLKIIRSVVLAPCTRLTNAHSTASSQSWMSGGLPDPCVRFRARVMRGIIAAHFPPLILCLCFPQIFRASH